MDNGHNRDQHILGLATNQRILKKKVEELETVLKQLIKNENYDLPDHRDNYKRFRDDDEFDSSDESQKEEEEKNIGSNQKKQKCPTVIYEMEAAMRNRYTKMVEKWSGDEESIAFIASECKKNTDVELEEDDEYSAFDYVDDHINELTGNQHALLYITMLERLHAKSESRIDKIKKENAPMKQELSTLRTKLEYEKRMNLNKDKLVREKEQQQELQVEYVNRLKKTLKEYEEREASNRSILKTTKEENEIFSTDFKRAEARSKRCQESLEAEKRDATKTINNLEVKHMSDVASLKRKHEERVNRHDKDARAYLNNEISRWKQKVDGAYHIANHHAGIRMTAARDILIRCINDIKSEIWEQNIELSDTLLSLCDNAPLQLSIVSGLNIVSGNSNSRENLRGSTSSRNVNNPSPCDERNETDNN